MHIEKLDAGRFGIVQGSRRIVITKAQYEDLYYAVPMDLGLLFRQINDTVIGTDALRSEFLAMVKEAGGSNAAMAALQESVKAVEPG
jgi:hypothetical protein